jgi:hypothetical protein
VASPTHLASLRDACCSLPSYDLIFMPPCLLVHILTTQWHLLHTWHPYGMRVVHCLLATLYSCLPACLLLQTCLLIHILTIITFRASRRDATRVDVSANIKHQPALEYRFYFIYPERLGNIIIHACFNTSFLVAYHGIGSERDHR